MNRFFSVVLVFFILCVGWGCAQIHIPSHCVSKIDDVSRLDPNSRTNDPLSKSTFINEICGKEWIQKYPHYGHLKKNVNHPQMERLFTSLAEFIDLASPHMTEKGMEGYMKLVRITIRERGNIANSNAFLDCLKNGFTHGNTFKGADFNFVMSQIADGEIFDFHPTKGVLMFKKRGVKFLLEEYQQGEGDFISHVMRGHTQNDYTIDLEVNQGIKKSLFDDPKNVIPYIEEALDSAKVRSYPDPTKPHIFDVVMNGNVGLDENRNPTNRIRIYLVKGTSDTISSAHPL